MHGELFDVSEKKCLCVCSCVLQQATIYKLYTALCPDKKLCMYIYLQTVPDYLGQSLNQISVLEGELEEIFGM